MTFIRTKPRARDSTRQFQWRGVEDVTCCVSARLQTNIDRTATRLQLMNVWAINGFFSLDAIVTVAVAAVWCGRNDEAGIVLAKRQQYKQNRLQPQCIIIFSVAWRKHASQLTQRSVSIKAQLKFNFHSEFVSANKWRRKRKNEIEWERAQKQNDHQPMPNPLLISVALLQQHQFGIPQCNFICIDAVVMNTSIRLECVWFYWQF